MKRRDFLKVSAGGAVAALASQAQAQAWASQHLFKFGVCDANAILESGPDLGSPVNDPNTPPAPTPSSCM